MVVGRRRDHDLLEGRRVGLLPVLVFFGGGQLDGGFVGAFGGGFVGGGGVFLPFDGLAAFEAREAAEVLTEAGEGVGEFGGILEFGLRVVFF